MREPHDTIVAHGRPACAPADRRDPRSRRARARPRAAAAQRDLVAGYHATRAIAERWRQQGVQVVDRATGNVTQTLLQPAAFIGLAFAPDGETLYASGGNEDKIYVYAWRYDGGTLTDSIILQ